MVSGLQKDKRPVYLNLIKIRLPIAGMVSLAHRASGILLFIAIPFAIYLLDLSILSSAGFDEVMLILQTPLVQLVGVMLFWSLAHHFFAGIRFLLIDADVGVDKVPARVGAWAVIVAEMLALAGFICVLLK